MLREHYALYGPDGLGNTDLIALILGTGAGGRSTTCIAAELVDSWPELHSMARVSPQSLARVRGVGMVRALRLQAALQLGLRAHVDTAPRAACLRTCEDAAGWLAPALQGLAQEELHALYLDRRLRPLCRRIVTVGNDAHTVVDCRQILRVAIEVGAAALVLAHNHPSGDPEPSREDVQVTKAVAAAAEIVGVSLLDHIVVGGGRWISLAQRGCVDLGRGPPGMVLLA